MAGTKVRICYFVHSGSVGGASISLLYLLQQMDRDRYDPLVVFLTESPVRKAFQDLAVETIIARGMTYFSHTTGESLSFRNPRGWLQLVLFLPSVAKTYMMIRQLKPDIVHLNSATLVPQAIGAKLAGAKVVWHIREHVVDGLVGVRKAALRWVARHCTDSLVTIMSGQGERLGCPDKAHLIYNFVDFQVFDRSLKEQQHRSPGEPKTVTMLGSDSSIKGTLELVKAYPLVRERVGEVRFVIAGAGSLNDSKNNVGPIRRAARRVLGRDSYQRKVYAFAKERCGDGVVFAGVVNDVPSLLAETDLVAFPSTAPHFARPIIEAGAMAIPVVASDIEGPREVVKQGETGLLVPPGNPVALADAIVTVLSDDGLARTLGEGGYSQARRLFDARVNSRATFTIYDSLLAGNGSSAATNEAGTENASEGRHPAAGHGIGRLWTVVFLGWLIALFGTYFYKMLTIPDRWEKIQALVGKIFT